METVEKVLFWTSPTTAYFIEKSKVNTSDNRQLKTSTSSTGVVYEEWCSKEDYTAIKPFC